MLASLRDIWRYRVLIQSLVVRELKARYRGSVLGFLWSFLNPLLLMLVYTLVFSVYLRFGGIEHYSLFLFCGLLPWIWFSSSLLEGCNAIMSGASLVKKVLFPPEILPITVVLSNLMHFLFGIPILLLFMLGMRVAPTWALLQLPLIIFLQLLFTVGMVLLLSSLSVHFRDITQILNNVVTLWFFLCPIIYPLEQALKALDGLNSELGPLFKILAIKLNPPAMLAVAYQNAIYYGRWNAWLDYGIILLVGLVTCILGLLVFNHFKYGFSEEV